MSCNCSGLASQTVHGVLLPTLLNKGMKEGLIFADSQGHVPCSLRSLTIESLNDTFRSLSITFHYASTTVLAGAMKSQVSQQLYRTSLITSLPQYQIISRARLNSPLLARDHKGMDILFVIRWADGNVKTVACMKPGRVISSGFPESMGRF